ncbi:FAD-dependent oxidoreductase [Fretibacter rubidus]|uniref:FAD-dependent oxidoreductase n=1 Tax=Fretibacter rubidus TaxID=570162 RepID=UPI003529DE91
MLTDIMAGRLHIGISGCGIGGMATALMMSRAGHNVQIFDRFTTPEPLGSGLVIQPVGLNVLKFLGLSDVILARGHKIFKMFGTECDSKRAVLNVDYGPPGGATFGIGIHRASLFDALYQALMKSSVTIIGGTSITSTQHASNKRTLTSEDGRVHGPFDLVIDASGAHSPLSPIKSRPLGYGALWGAVAWPDRTNLPTGRLSQSYQKAHHMLGVLPIGTMPGSNKQCAAIFWSEPRERLSDWYQSDLDAWKAKTIALWSEFAPFVAQIKSHSDMTAARYSHGTLMRPFGNHIAYIGDSAHQASPQLGQGANMALLDAKALADSLDEYDDIGMALGQYAAARRYHVGLYQLFSAVFTPFYQSNSRVLPKLRDNVMNPMS